MYWPWLSYPSLAALAVLGCRLLVLVRTNRLKSSQVCLNLLNGLTTRWRVCWSSDMAPVIGCLLALIAFQLSRFFHLLLNFHQSSFPNLGSMVIMEPDNWWMWVHSLLAFFKSYHWVRWHQTNVERWKQTHEPWIMGKPRFPQDHHSGH